MDILIQTTVEGVITYSLTDNGLILVNEIFRLLVFLSGIFLFLTTFYITTQLLKRS